MLLLTEPQTDEEIACYDRLMKALAAPDVQDSADITREAEWLREIKDIANKLKILEAIFVDQLQVVDNALGTSLASSTFYFISGPELKLNLTRQLKGSILCSVRRVLLTP